MGEIADMMLEGDLCAGCGAFIDEQGGDGYPRYCSKQCAIDQGALESYNLERAAPRRPAQWKRTDTNKVKCPHCERRTAPTGLADHIRAKHPDLPDAEIQL